MESKVNGIYLQERTIARLRKQFLSSRNIPNIHLHEFFSRNFYNKLKRELKRAKLVKNFDRLSHSYHVGELNKILIELLNNKDLLQFISFIINKKVNKINASCFSFSWKDYTLLHDLEKENPGFDVILDFTENWNEYAGGQVIYTESKGESLIVPSVGNSLLIAHRKSKHVKKFVKYVNNHAGKNKKLLVIGRI